MTHEQVDKLESLLREAQEKVEEAGRIVCSERGEYASRVWARCNSHSKDISDTIHSCYRLRPEGDNA